MRWINDTYFLNSVHLFDGAYYNFGFFIYCVAITCTLPNAIVVRLKMLISVELMFLGSLENWHIPYTPLNLRSDSAIS